MARMLIADTLLFLFSLALTAADLSSDVSNINFQKANLVTVKQEEIKLKTKKVFNKKKYYASINNGASISISKANYNLISLLKGKAAESHQDIRLDMSQLSNTKAQHSNQNGYIFLIEKPPAIDISELNCCVCMEEKKCILLEPCNHLCLCPACEKAISSTTKKCPICRKEYKRKKKVYF